MNVAGGLGIGRLLFSLFTRSSGKTRMFMIIAAIVGFVLFRPQMLSLLGMGGATSQPPAQTQTTPARDDENKKFISTVVGMCEDVWGSLLPQYNIRYRKAMTSIYSGTVRMETGGVADSRMGPFYLPAEQRIYIDPSFFTELHQKFGASGDFAAVYVLAHEYGHHIQNILGRTSELHKLNGRISKREYNRKSVRLELHADFLAGVFTNNEHKKNNSLDPGDIQEAIKCAIAIGDDRLQRQAGQRVRKDHFTHGTSEQRARWFKMGYQSGDLRVGEQIYSMPYEQL